MDTVSCQLKLGAWEIDTRDDPHTELVRVVVDHGMNSPVAQCRVSLFVSPAKAPGLLDQAIGAAASLAGIGGPAAGSPAFSIDVRGKRVAHDDAMEITLGVGDARHAVMKATAVSVRNQFGRVEIEGRTALGTLARARADAVYSNQSAGDIIRALAGEGGVDVGQVDAGDTYAYVVADSGASLFEHLRRVAALEGMDVYDDAAGALVAKVFNKSSADHTLHYGIEVVDVRIGHAVSVLDKVRVTGEGPSGTSGPPRWHQLLLDPTPVQASAGDGVGLYETSRPAARSSAAADRHAKALLGAARDAATSGTVRVMGNAAIALGDSVEIKGAPWDDVNGTYKVVRVRHVVGRTEGFVTTLGVTGLGGASSASGLLGQAAGALAGAVGL